MSKNNRNHQNSEVRELKETISKLKAKNRRLKKDKEKLISELQTLKKNFDTSILYIDEKLQDIPVDEVVRYFAKKKAGKLKDIEKTSLSTRERTIKKFQNLFGSKED